MRFQTLPHKNLFLSALVALSIFLIAFSATRNKQAMPSDVQALVVQTLPEVADATSIDTDRDLLPDWKERLYGSDINTPDTDGDGTSDGDEVSVGRNPVVPNTAGNENPPNDKLAYLLDPSFATSSTDMLGLKKEFFARYLAEGSRDVKETTFSSLIKRVDTKPFMPPHEIIGLNISSDNSAEGVRVYINTFGDVMGKYLSPTMDRSEDVVIRDSLTDINTETRTELQLFAVGYKNFSNDLLALRVPSSLAKAHLLIVNGYAGMGAGLLGLQKMEENPMDGTAAYEAYLKYRLDVVNGYAMIVSYVIDQHLTFTPDEPGYPFYWNVVGQKTRAAK